MSQVSYFGDSNKSWAENLIYDAKQLLTIDSGRDK